VLEYSQILLTVLVISKFQLIKFLHIGRRPTLNDTVELNLVYQIYDYYEACGPSVSAFESLKGRD